MGTVEIAYDTYETNETRSDLNPIILMHGLFWNKSLYRDIARDLCQVTERKVFSLDMRNHGDSPCCEECDVFLMAEDIKRFLDEKGLKRVIFVCHSFSGTIGYLIILDRPEAVEKIVMVDSPPFYEFSEHSTKKLVLSQVTTQNRLLNTLDYKMTLKDAKAKFHRLAELATQGQEYFYKKAACDLTKENGKFKWKIDLEFLMEKYWQRAFAIKARGSSDHEILMIRCQDSLRVSDTKFELMLKFNPKARLVTFQDTTHLLMFEKTKEFVEVVKDFLNEKTIETQDGNNS